jgi:hypothetical protein
MGICEMFSRNDRPNSGGLPLAGRLGGGVIDDCFCHDSISSLNRHLHDVLVRLNQLVTHLGQGLERHAGLLRGDHHVGQVDAALADLEGVGQLVEACWVSLTLLMAWPSMSAKLLCQAPAQGAAALWAWTWHPFAWRAYPASDD